MAKKTTKSKHQHRKPFLWSILSLGRVSTSTGRRVTASPASTRSILRRSEDRATYYWTLLGSMLVWALCLASVGNLGTFSKNPKGESAMPSFQSLFFQRICFKKDSSVIYLGFTEPYNIPHPFSKTLSTLGYSMNVFRPILYLYNWFILTIFIYAVYLISTVGTPSAPNPLATRCPTPHPNKAKDRVACSKCLKLSRGGVIWIDLPLRAQSWKENSGKNWVICAILTQPVAKL